MSAVSAATTQLTDLLTAWSEGDDDALETLTPLVYQEMHRLAYHYLLGESPGRLQPTELVNEAFVRLVENDISWTGRAHFYVVAARTMRRILVDLARRHAANKRRGSRREESLWDGDELRFDLPASPALSTVDVLVLDEALTELRLYDERKSKAVELRYFGGLSVAEVALVLQVSVPTAERDLRLAKAWLGQSVRTTKTSGGT
ncbi:MAG: ECF-type sigma factor [Acidobacteriota bacterium]